MARPGLTGHRKFRRLVRALGSMIIARGALELLWDSCYESGEDYVGTSDDIETLVGWNGEHGILTRALVEAGAPEGHGFIEPVPGLGNGDAAAFRVHDLWHHAPEYVGKRRKREMDRRSKVEPVGDDRRSADAGGRLSQISDWQNEVPPPPSPSPSPSPSPVKEHSWIASATDVVDLWNQLVTAPIPQVTKLTNDRQAKINARLKSYPELSVWRTVIEYVNGQTWCRAPGTGEHPNWVATLDWLTKNDGNVQRCFEKAYVASQPIPEKPEKIYADGFGRDWNCPHTPRCPHRAACSTVMARKTA